MFTWPEDSPSTGLLEQTTLPNGTDPTGRLSIKGPRQATTPTLTQAHVLTRSPSRAQVFMLAVCFQRLAVLPQTTLPSGTPQAGLRWLRDPERQTRSVRSQHQAPMYMSAGNLTRSAGPAPKTLP